MQQGHIFQLTVITTVLVATSILCEATWTKLWVTFGAALFMLFSLSGWYEEIPGEKRKILNACTWRPLLNAKMAGYVSCLMLTIGAMIIT